MGEIQTFLKCIGLKEDELVQYKVNCTEKYTVRPKLELVTFRKIQARRPRSYQRSQEIAQ